MANQPKIAIVHDWLVGGGAELVVDQLHQMYPDAPIYTSYCTPEWRQRLDDKVVTGWMQKFGRLRKLMAFPRMWWFSHLDLSAYDIVISSSGNGEAKWVRTRPKTLHICYCHTPTHYYWRHYQTYMDHPGLGWLDPVARLVLRLLIRPLRQLDYRAAQRPDFFIANSKHIQSDIKRFYNRDSEVVHPPIYLERFTKSPINQPRSGYISSGRLVPYKHNDIIIQACNKLAVPLTIIGAGPDEPRLRKLAGPTIKLLGRAPDETVEAELAKAKAFLFAAFEDFGITPVEALASGTPVIAYKAGGALDYVEPGKTGLFFEEQTVEALCEAILEAQKTSFDGNAIRAYAEQFSKEQFRQRLQQTVDAFYKTREV